MLMRIPNMSARSLLFGLFALLLSLSTARAQDTVAQAQQSEPEHQQKLIHYSLYFENYKNENYKSALKDLRWMLKNAPTFVPKSKTGDDRHFRRAFNAYTELAENTEDAEKKKAYLDSAYVMLEQAPERLQELEAEFNRYEWIMRKGRFIQQYGDTVEEVDAPAVQYYRKAFRLAPDKMQPYYINTLIQDYLDQEKQQKALEFMEQVEEQRGDEEKVQKILKAHRKKVFGRNPSAQIAFLEKKLENNADNAETMARLFELYLQQGQREKASQLSSKLLETNPSLSIMQRIAKMRLEDGRAQEAFDLYKKGLSMSDKTPSAQYYYNMGVAQRQLGNKPEARRYFRKALEVDDSFGRAYISIGDLYAQSVSDCGGSKMERNDRAVYWLAVDMYQRAKEADPSVASTANSKIQTYRQYFPSAEDIFYREDWDQGSSFRIDYGCYSWINQTTTVRKRPS